MALALINFPIRCFAVSSQILNGQMWRRNGISVQGQALHYISPPVCRLLSDLDLVLLQYCTVTGDLDLFLSLLLNRFNLERWMSEDDFIPLIDHVEPNQIVS